ncbi:MAG: hypothetical protein EOP48_31265, partial [Sphingobacteriales bacterium]
MCKEQREKYYLSGEFDKAEEYVLKNIELNPLEHEYKLLLQDLLYLKPLLLKAEEFEKVSKEFM